MRREGVVDDGYRATAFVESMRGAECSIGAAHVFMGEEVYDGAGAEREEQGRID